MSYLTRKEIDEMKPEIEKAVHKFLGFGEPAIVTTAVNCIVSGYDKRKTADKLSALLDEKKAMKLTEKMFNIYDDARAAQKAKKRSHDEDKDKDKDSKKAKIKENDSKNDKLPETTLSPEKIKQMMANAQREIEERKRALKAIKQDDVSIKPSFKARDPLPLVSSMYTQGLLSKTDSDRARKIAALQAQIKSKFNSGLLNNLNIPDKPTPLILDESGRTVDITGKEVQLTHVVPTLKANIRAKKREEFKAQLQESKGPEEIQDTHFFDTRIGVKIPTRGKRALKFHEPGKFQQLADRIRMKAQLEKLQNEISQIARKTGISSATKLALIAPKTEALIEDVPNVEWWDSVIMSSGYPTRDEQVQIKVTTITNLVEHPIQVKPPTESLKPVYMPVFLTKKERKKLRRQNRREAWKEEQEKIRLGLEPPPEPKLRISNLMRVLGTEAVQDPTKIEAHVRQQMAKRLKAHEDANAARRLTADQRREKKARKLKEDTSLGVYVTVYRIRDLLNNASKKFKVEANAKQLYLTGCVMLFRDCNVVVVEGGAKQLKKYRRLMMNRIKWEEDIVKDNDGNDVPNKCVVVWEGSTTQRHFGEIKFKVCPIEKMAREHFKKHQVEQYWDLAYSGAVLDNTDDTHRLIIFMSSVRGTTLPLRMMQDLDKRANNAMEKYDQAERTILDAGTQLSKGSPAWYLGASHEMTEAAKNLSRQALKSETMALMMVESLHMSPNEAIKFLPTMALGISFCPDNSKILGRTISECKRVNTKYRTHSGKCNNALHPTWGASLEAYTRLLPPEYNDGVSLPRVNLPSAREISVNVFSGVNDLKHPFLMAMTSLFGQFVANDLAHTPRMELLGGRRLKCCDVDYESFHPECFPIQAENVIGCMEYTRSVPHPGSNHQSCRLGPRQQINQATSFLDLSTIYGSSEEVAKSLRAGKNGLLSTQGKNLPIPSKNFNSCRSDNKALPCFLSGDPRINENPGIALLHVLFLREHNRVAKQLSELNPHWDDEKLYQESRRIVIGEMQHITYNEFLPAVFGESNLERYYLRLVKPGYSTSYDSRIDPTLSNAAASAGLFFFAALTPKTFDLIDSHSATKSGERSLLSAFYAPQELYEAGAIDRLITGATVGHSRKPSGLNEVLLGRYFHDGKTNEVAIDYAAQAIQQGRDHGLPSYTKWRLFCDLPEVTTFRDLESTMSRDFIDKLERVYKNVNDIDLVTGALSEAAVEGSVMGPTFLCLLGLTFKNARLGDRYWYENAKTPGSFTPRQLEEIRKAKMAKILCDNGDRLKRVQPKAFLLKDPFLNEMAECWTYQGESIDLSAWKESNIS
ncbi:uncharacterized protein Prp3 [Chelonus insularis]|uniref:uncharacterized protein Prp3 n=1 Tax=Chelonus insularis TaxID=460826 RepID=UPI00158E860B|nr:uncharacterized protein LOC118070704 [Chelonus insularis]